MSIRINTLNSNEASPSQDAGFITPVGRFVGRRRPLTAALMMVALLLTASRADAAVTVSTTGAKNINLDTRFPGPSPAFTPIDAPAPRISESSAGEIADSIVINAPAGNAFAFSVVSTPAATPISGDIVLGPAVVFPFVITIPVITPSTVPSEIEINGIVMRPTGCQTPGPFTVSVTTDDGGAGDLNGATLVTVTLLPGPTLSRYALSSDSPQTGGTPITVTISALDGCDNPLPNATVPSDITLGAQVEGFTGWGSGAPFALTNINTVPDTATIAASSVFDANGRGTFTVTNNEACAESTNVTATHPNGPGTPTTPLSISWTATAECCGEGTCADSENCQSCEADCGSCCGNGFCGEPGENCTTCPSDCECEFCIETCSAGACGPACGDGVCADTCEDCSTCPVDCGCAATSCQIITCQPDHEDSDVTGCHSMPDPACGACCYENIDFQTAAAPQLFCAELEEQSCISRNGVYFGDGTVCESNSCAPDLRVDTVKKGSLLIFPAVELRWAPSVVAGGPPVGAFTLTRDTIITLVNDFTRDIDVKLYFVNGDAPTEPIYADELETILIERGHNGWNQVDCGIELTENESTYLSLANGGSGCQRFTILDPGTPPGRPNLEPDGGRVLRGFVIAFAVDDDQNEISFNHLTGHATVIDYDLRSAWEYQAYAFQAINPSAGAPTDGTPGELSLDGLEYDFAFNQLIFDFYAVGSTVLSNAGVTVMLDTDLTLHPVSADLRQDSCGPITTKAHFDIWNANEEFRSGTTRCITCWDQTLLSAYSVGFGEDNNFVLADLDTDKGKARIDGMASIECDDLFIDDFFDLIIDHFENNDCEEGVVAGEGQEPNGRCCDYTINESQDAALLGVAAKILNFSGGASGRTHAGMNLVGAGQEEAQILFDIPSGPETATDKNNRRPIKNASQRSSIGGH